MARLGDSCLLQYVRISEAHIFGRGNPMPNAFHPRRRLTTLELHRLVKDAEEAVRQSAHRVSQCFLGVNILDFYTHALSYPHTHTPNMG